MGIDPAQIASPWHAAAASFASFTAGAILPLLAITLTPAAVRIAVTAIAVLAAFAATGAVSATLGQAPHGPAVVRNVVGGLLAWASLTASAHWSGTSPAQRRQARPKLTCAPASGPRGW